MIDKRALAPWIKRFLLEYLPGDRNLARNTQKSYRDAIRLLVLFASTRLHKKADELLIDDLTGNLLREFTGRRRHLSAACEPLQFFHFSNWHNPVK